MSSIERNQSQPLTKQGSHGFKERHTATSCVLVCNDMPPHDGQAKEVAEGIWWARLKLGGIIDHVNVYLLDGGDSWTLVDTGSNTEGCKFSLGQLLASQPFHSKPVSQVIATHFHPDHIGLAGWFAERGATLATTRISWLYARMLQLDDRDLPREEQVRFAERGGLKGVYLEAYRRRRPSAYPQLVTPIPFCYRRLSEGDEVVIGLRTWKVLLGDGHAPGHLTLWSNDDIALTGDQILPSTVSHLMASPSEPHEDPILEWLASCCRFKSQATHNTLALPGHGLPFRGIPSRCAQLIENVDGVIQRLLERLQRPATAIDCMDAVYRRPLAAGEADAFLAEVIAYLNHLEKHGLVHGDLLRDGTVLYRLSRPHEQPSHN